MFWKERETRTINLVFRNLEQEVWWETRGKASGVVVLPETTKRGGGRIWNKLIQKVKDEHYAKILLSISKKMWIHHLYLFSRITCHLTQSRMLILAFKAFKNTLFQTRGKTCTAIYFSKTIAYQISTPTQHETTQAINS